MDNQSVNNNDNKVNGNGVEGFDTIADKEDISDAMKTWRRFLIGPIVFLYMLGAQMSFYIVTEYTKEVWLEKTLHEKNLTNVTISASDCNADPEDPVYHAQTTATSIASRYVMYYSIAQGIPAIASSMILGPYCDALGRRIVMAVGILGTIARVILCVIIIKYEFDLLFFIGPCFVEGCTGQFGTVIHASSSYMGDITKTHKQRKYGMTYIFVMVGLALALSGLVTGYLVQPFGFFVPIVSSGVLLVLSLLVMTILLPESFPSHKRLKDQRMIHMIYNSVSFFVDKDLGKSRWKYQLLFATHALCAFTYLGQAGLDTLYQLAEPFCWSVEKVGAFSAARMVFGLSVAFGPVKFYQKFLSDVSIAIVGVISFAAGFLLSALAWNDTLLYVAALVGSLGMLEGVLVKTIASCLTSDQKQGAMFSAFSAIEIIMMMVSNVGITGIYSVTIHFMRGLTYMLMTAVDIIAIILLIILLVRWKREERQAATEKT